MPDIGFGELILIVFVAIVVLGPDKLPDAMKDIARFIKKVRRMWSDATLDIRRELEMEEMKEELNSYKNRLKELQDDVKSDLPEVPKINSSRNMEDFLK